MQNRTQLYEQDFYAWTEEQVKLLKNQQWGLLDTDNLIEELESLGKQQRRELENRLAILIGHLLKWEYQPHLRCNSWRSTIREQRRKIQRHLAENPSLKSYLHQAFTIAYEDGRDLAIQETNLPDRTFPDTNPYPIDDVLCFDFFPGE